MNAYIDPLCPSQKKNSSRHPQRELRRNGNVIYARKYLIAGIYGVITTCWSIVARADPQQVSHSSMNSIHKKQLQNDIFLPVQSYLSYECLKQVVYLISDTNWGIIEQRGCMLCYLFSSVIVVSMNFPNKENEIGCASISH